MDTLVDVAVLLTLAFDRQSAEVLCKQWSHRVGVDIAHQIELEVGGIGKAFAVDFKQPVVADTVEVCLLQALRTNIIVINNADHAIGEGGLRIEVLVLQGVARALHCRGEGIVVAPGRCEVKVNELKHRLQILLHAVAVNTFCTGTDACRSACLFAGKLLVQLDSREAAESTLTHQPDIARVDVFVVAVEAIATPRCRAEDYLVGAVVGLLDVNLHAVAQGDKLRVIDVVGNLLDLHLAFEFRHKRVCADLFGKGCDIFSIDFCQSRQQFLLRRTSQSFLLWHEDKDDTILLRQFCKAFIYHLQREVRHNLMHVLMPPLDACSWNIVKEMTDIGVDERRVRTLVAGFVCSINLREILVLEALILALCEAVARSTKQLSVCCLDTFCITIFLHADVKRKCILCLCHKEVAITNICTRERSICLTSYLIQALIEHTCNGILHEVNHHISQGSPQLSRQRVALEHDGCHHAGELLVRADEDERLLVVGHRELFANSGIGRCGSNIGKHRLQLLLDFIGVNVAHNNQSLQVWTIPFAVIAAESLIGEVLHDLHRADGHAVGILAVLADKGQSFFYETQLGAAAHTPLLFDDAALLVDFLVLEQQVVAPVVQDEQTGIDGSDCLDIHIIYIIYSLVEGRIGVEVLAELHADALQVLLQGITRKVCRAVEAHVLEEVCEATLVVLLLHGTHTLRDVEVTTLLRPFVVADIIGESVL